MLYNPDSYIESREVARELYIEGVFYETLEELKEQLKLPQEFEMTNETYDEFSKKYDITKTEFYALSNQFDQFKSSWIKDKEEYYLC